ncbi:BlaI/MecI/CopY family transcriptional regulator [Candidatus Woesebacteria bacterium]|nr:MAG: BlaI/MecI/CopY family transcriptional regulator [Candidatus Woesebacteria bacterium]
MKPSLGELEQQIMDIVWECKNCSARDVLNKLETDKKLAYTTVATILQRLFDKGLLTRKENTAGHIYSPKISKGKYTKNVAQSFLKNFISSFGDTAIASFADSIDKLPEKKRKYFLEVLDEYDKNK